MGHYFMGVIFALIVTFCFWGLVFMVPAEIIFNNIRGKALCKFESEWDEKEWYIGFYDERAKVKKVLCNKYDNIYNIITKIFIFLVLISTIAGTIFYGYPCNNIDEQPWNEVNYTTHSIVNLSDNNEIKGQFRGKYVRGYIGEETIYHYYYKTVDGGMKLQKASEENTTIYLTAEVAPCAKWYRRTRSLWWLEKKEYYCKIYVPEGTVTTEFVIDME